MLPTKDASSPNPGQPDAAPARAADGPRTGSASGPTPSTTATPPVASQRPSHGHAGQHYGHGASHGGHQSGHGQSGHGPAPARRESAGRESKSTGSPNIQDVFLNYARREKLTVVIQLLDGQAVEGRIKNFDRFALIIDHAGVDHLVFKHAIATIRSPRSIGSYYASHEAS
jgi:host factor-I protein